MKIQHPEHDAPTHPFAVEALAAGHCEGALNRREFLGRLIMVTGSVTTAHLWLEKSGLAQVVSDKETQNSTISAPEVSFPNGELMGS